MEYRSLYRIWIIFWIIFSILVALLMQQLFDFGLFLDILISVNIVTFLLFGFDKMQSIRHGLRVPEKNLWLAAFVGGSIGAIFGMKVFKHKTRKISFQFVLWILILIQIILIIFYLKSGNFIF